MGREKFGLLEKRRIFAFEISRDGAVGSSLGS